MILIVFCDIYFGKMILSVKLTSSCCLYEKTSVVFLIEVLSRGLGRAVTGDTASWGQCAQLVAAVHWCRLSRTSAYSAPTAVM